MVWISANSRLGFGRQTDMTTKASVTRLLGITSRGMEFPDKQVEAKKYPSFGVGRRYFGVFPGKYTRPGSIPLIPVTGEIFYYLFGQDTFTAGAPNLHVMSPQNAAELPYMTLGAALLGSPNFLREFVGVAVENARLSLSEAGELQLDLDVQGYDVENEETASPALFAQPSGAGLRPYMFYDRNANVGIGGAYDYTANTYSGGRTWGKVRGFSWNMSNGLKVHHFSQAGGSQKPGLMTVGQPDFGLQIELTVSGKLAADTDAVYDLLEGDTKSDVLIPFYRSANDRLDFVFDNALITDAGHPWREDGNEITVTCNVEPEEIRVVARDSIAQYSTL